MLPKICSIPECGKPNKARGWCSAHWWRWKTHGDPLGAVYTPIPCSIDGCETISHARSWCSAHYQRWLKYSDPTAGNPGPNDRTTLERFLEHVAKGPSHWEWTGTKSQKGYGRMSVGGKAVPAHRLAWQLMRGEIPEGMQIDHRCMVKSCVNPAHLRVVTNKQNGEHKGLSKKNTSGFRGVGLHKATGKWVGRVRHNNKLYHAGLFDTPEEANDAVVSLRNELFTHNDLDRVKK